MSTRSISWGQKRPVHKAGNLTTFLSRCHEIWNLNFLEPSGPFQACNGTALPFTRVWNEQWPFQVDNEHMPSTGTRPTNVSANLREMYVLLTVHPCMILVNNQLDAQIFMHVYFYSLHVSGSHMPIIRRIIVSMSGMQVQPALGHHITNRQSLYITPACLKSAYTTQQIVASSWRWTY